MDDDPDIRQMLLDRLNSYGYAVETAIDGREALDALRRDWFDGMLLDIRMPEIGGLEVLRQARARYPETRIVMITASTSSESLAEAISQGARAYLLKPFDAPQLKQVVEQCFGPAA